MSPANPATLAYVRERNQKILKVWKEEGLRTKELAERFAMAPCTVSLILKKTKRRHRRKYD